MGLPRVSYLNMTDLANVEANMAQATWKLHVQETLSVHLWARTNTSSMLHYQQYAPRNPAAGDEERPFQLVLSHSNLLDLMVKFGHGNTLLIDSTFGTNSHKVCMLSHAPDMAFAALHMWFLVGVTAWW